MIHDDEVERDKADFRESYVGRHFRMLRDHVWHTTSPSGLLGILDSGCIKPNRGDLPHVWGKQSASSYGEVREDTYASSTFAMFLKRRHPNVLQMDRVLYKA
jgi:hypothetical protein